jgi:hypothetical protein
MKRKRALLESNLPRNNWLRLIETVRGREWSINLIRSRPGLKSPPDDRSLMPQKTHGSWSLLLRLRCVRTVGSAVVVLAEESARPCGVP